MTIEATLAEINAKLDDLTEAAGTAPLYVDQREAARLLSVSVAKFARLERDGTVQRVDWSTKPLYERAALAALGTAAA